MEKTAELIKSLWFEILLLLLLIGVVILVARLLANWARREEPAEELTLEDVQQMLRAGRIDQGEFERLRQTIMARQRELMGPAAPAPDRTDLSGGRRKNARENSSSDLHKPSQDA